MTAYIRFEISLLPLSDNRYAVRAALESPQHGVDAHPLRGDPVIRLDTEALLAASLDINRYSELLTAALFANPALVTAFEVARGQAELLSLPLRFVLQLPEHVGPAHQVRWETLSDPSRGGFLALNERIWLSRRLDSPDLSPPTGADPPGPALVAVASPGDLPRFGLRALDRARYRAQFVRAYGPAQVLSLPQANEAVTAQRLLASMGMGVRIACLVCHGSFVNGQSIFWLEDEQGNADRVRGDLLAQQIATLARRPTLAILITCHSAAAGEGQIDPTAGAYLARAGIPAVLAMQDRVHAQTIDRLLPVFIAELQRDGRADRALAVARRTVADQQDWSVPVLFVRGRDSQIWSPDPAPADGQGVAAPRAPIMQTHRGRIDYRHGLGRLRALLADQGEQLALLATFEARLEENLRDERLFGSNEMTRAGRAQIIYGLNAFALETCQVTFNELCVQ